MLALIPMSPVIAINEMDNIKKIIDKWLERVNEGIPCVTFEAPDDQFDMFMKHWVGELRLLAGSADNLADVLSGAR